MSIALHSMCYQLRYKLLINTVYELFTINIFCLVNMSMACRLERRVRASHSSSSSESTS